MNALRVACAISISSLMAPVAGAAQTTAPTEVVLTFTASDGTPLEGKLNLPAGASNPVPVVFHLHGAGTRLAPELAWRSPDGIIGLALAGYAADNQRDTLAWQNSIGPWRAIQKRFPAASDGVLRRGEYDAAVAADASLATLVPFAAIDTDSSRTVDADEMARVTRPRLDALIWQALLNLSSAYLLDGWDTPPNYQHLLAVDVPIAIFHGTLDNTTRVEGVHEAEAAFRAAGKANLEVHIYTGHDHDLNRTVESAATGGPQPFRDAFAFMAALASGGR